ncbi:DNA-processing protein DprA [Nitrosovibrio sp. Nv4]|uniref:DNA-processing protein DprA n=1 Tax=Nitrosovibrio sp. Nv4 TaxID=1945880 RepID=UPI000BE274EC|nr:DNA-processing protein DprA [Nitrosovibrio sp. Nv4]
MTDLKHILNKPPISPIREMGGYEALWAHENSSFKTLAQCFRDNPDLVPSELVTEHEIEDVLPKVLRVIEKAGIKDLGIRVHGSEEYPLKLRDAANPIEFFYFRGWWDLVNSKKSVAVVGTRNPSEEGLRRTKKIVKLLIRDGFTVVSGLAKGVDSAAHKAAIDSGGKTVAVIGTPVTESYPAENVDLQEHIAENYLLISQVPILRYSQQTYRGNRLFFPERNITMSALTDATIIIEAGETSGTLTQARAALKQGRKLFILDSCFQNPNLSWPERFEKIGAIRVRSYDDIAGALE